jgi:hypothetical protein
MSLGSAGRPSTTTIDPTPPALRPIQQQLAAMMSARLSGQGRASVPTYGQGLTNIQQQLYGVNPRTATTPAIPGGGGGGGVISPPDKPQFGGTGGGWANTVMPEFTRPALAMPPSMPTSPRMDLIPTYGDTLADPLTANIGSFTRGGPLGLPQGGSYTGPLMDLPKYGALNSGSRLMFSMSNPYGGVR